MTQVSDCRQPQRCQSAARALIIDLPAEYFGKLRPIASSKHSTLPHHRLNNVIRWQGIQRTAPINSTDHCCRSPGTYSKGTRLQRCQIGRFLLKNKFQVICFGDTQQLLVVQSAKFGKTINVFPCQLSDEIETICRVLSEFPVTLIVRLHSGRVWSPICANASVWMVLSCWPKISTSRSLGAASREAM
jgi:hypothetical protein